MKDLVKEKIIELVPEIAERDVQYCSFKNCWLESHRPITLADVLRAWMIEQPGDSVFPENIGDVVQHWNLATNYDNQTQEVKDFIGTLLGVPPVT